MENGIIVAYSTASLLSRHSPGRSEKIRIMVTNALAEILTEYPREIGQTKSAVPKTSTNFDM
jgi:hypothetical protein